MQASNYANMKHQDKCIVGQVFEWYSQEIRLGQSQRYQIA